MTDIKKSYLVLKKKYGLPEFDAINAEFEIGAIEDDDFLLGSIRKQIYDRTDAFAKFLGQLLQPDTNLVELYECKVFDEDEKEKIFDIYRKLMVLHRYSVEVYLLQEEKEYAQFIKTAFKQWIELKKDLLKIVVKIKESWKTEDKAKTVLEYLG
jgi:hypothetical protein